MSKESAMALATGGESSVSGISLVNSDVAASPPVQTTTQPAGTPEISSRQFSQLAKKESEIVRLRQVINQEKEALAKEREQAQKITKTFHEFEELQKTDKIAALKKIGFSETDIFNFLANQEPPELTPEQKAAQAAEEAAQAKIKQFEDNQTKRDQEAQKKADDQIIQSYRGQVSGLIKADPGKFEYCNHYGAIAEELIYETVLAVVSESQGKDVPTPAEAAQMVEEFYEEQDKAMANLKKRQPVPLKPEVSPQPQPSQRTRTLAESPTQPKPVRTLTNAATSTVASTRLKLNETAAQKRERLIEKLRNGG